LIRFFQSKIRNKPAIRARFMSTTFLSLVLGTLYYQMGDSQLDAANRVSLVFLSVIFPCFSAASLIPMLVSHRPIYFREHQSNMYSNIVYYSSRFISEVPLIVVESFVYSTVLYWLSGLTAAENGRHYGLFFACFLMVRSTAIAFTEFCGTVGSDAESGTAMNSVLLTLMMLFSGFLVSKNNIPNGWIWLYYLSFFRYPISFLCNNELRDLTFECQNHVGAVPLPLPNATNPAFCPLPEALNSPNCYAYLCPITSGQQMLTTFNLIDDDMSTMYLSLFAFFLGFRLLAFLTLKFVSHIKR